MFTFRIMDEFDLQPLLVGPRLVLRPLESQDWDALYGAARDPLIWAGHPAHDRWTEPVFRKFFADALESGGALVATLPGSGEIIGSSRYDARRVNPGEMEIGWSFLARTYWGSGMNAAVKGAMLAHAFHYVERVLFFVGEGNGRSRRAMEKIGGVLTDRTHVTEMAGKPVKHVIYSIEREAFDGGGV
jgi:RimJ/RimL family protein N-acetyltransferase